MGYNVEISVDIAKHPDFSRLKREITDFAIDSGCDHYYYLYEMEGGGRFKRNHCIIVVNYDEIYNCANFLKVVKKNKDMNIECIYEDSIVCKLIYASRFYQTTMDREKATRYNKFRRERSLSNNEKTILDEVSQKSIC